MSIQECAESCLDEEKIFFAHKSDGGACWCAGKKDGEAGGLCGWSNIGESEYNVYVAAAVKQEEDGYVVLTKEAVERMSEIIKMERKRIGKFCLESDNWDPDTCKTFINLIWCYHEPCWSPWRNTDYVNPFVR